MFTRATNSFGDGTLQAAPKLTDDAEVLPGMLMSERVQGTCK